LTHTAQTTALMVVGQTMSFVSLFGIFILFALFALSMRFQKPDNRLIFFMCFSMVGLNIATLISEDGRVAG
jgi:hypothetical protein